MTLHGRWLYEEGEGRLLRTKCLKDIQKGATIVMRNEHTFASRAFHCKCDLVSCIIELTGQPKQ